MDMILKQSSRLQEKEVTKSETLRANLSFPVATDRISRGKGKEKEVTKSETLRASLSFHVRTY